MILSEIYCIGIACVGVASNFIVDQSIDGTTWLSITQLPLQSGPPCISLPPTRFVRISSGVGTGFYQVSY